MQLFSHSSETLQVVILLLPDSSLMSLASTLDTMRAANRISRRRLFQWRVVTLDGEPAKLSCGQSIHPEQAFANCGSADLLICIAAFRHEQHMGRQMVTLFRQQARQFTYLGGVESGSWVLARAGFLDGRSATTHWEDLEDFRNKYPKVDVVPDRYVISGRIFTTGGASPTFDLMLYLIRSRFGYTLALEVASVFIYDAGQHSESPQQLVSLGLLENREPRVSQAIRTMQDNIDNPLSISEIAAQLELSNRTLEQLFRRQLDSSPLQYYKRLRLQAARRLVVDSSHSMQEIAVRTGFSSLAVFSRAFTQFYLLSPSQYRRQHRG